MSIVSFAVLTPSLFNPGPSSTPLPLITDVMSLALSYDNEPSTSDPASMEFRTSRPRQDLFSDKSYDYGLPQQNSDVAKPFITTSSSSILSPSFQTCLSTMYSSEVQSSGSMFFPPSSGHTEELMPIGNDTNGRTLQSSGVSGRTASTSSLSVNAPSYSAPSYSTSSTAGPSSMSYQLSHLDLFASTDYVPGPLTMATNVLTSSSPPSSTELSSFGLDILDSDLKTPPITTSMQSIPGPFSMSTSLSMHHSQSYGSVIDNQATSTNIFETGVPVVTSSPSTSSNSMVQSDVWRPY